MESIIDNLTAYRDQMTILVLLNTLENIVKGGRLSKFQGSLAKILNIKIILKRADHGKVEIFEKVRGHKKFKRRILEIIQASKSDFTNTVFGITHTGNEAEVEAIRKELDDLFQPKDIIVNYMGATMGTYAGKDGMIISF
jgi:DegV family protein with EDD domain